MVKNENIDLFFLQFKSIIQNAEVLINTHTQSLVPKGRPGLKLDVMVDNILFRFDENGIPSSVWKNIQDKTLCTLTYNIPVQHELIKRPISFIVAIQDKCTPTIILEINDYVRQSLTWLYIAQKSAKKTQCNSSPLIIYMLLSPLQKMLPLNSRSKTNPNPPIDWVNANTAFTMICNDKSFSKSNAVREIVIYRKEEWFKVFIHETFHNYGFDFSNASDVLIQHGNQFVLDKLYPVNSKVNLYEAYTECWARIIVCVFSTAKTQNVHLSDEHFLFDLKRRLDEEITFSFFQAAKVLDYMKIDSYEKLIQGHSKTEYRENTSVLSYYVITLVLLSNYPEFISWCFNQNHVKQSPSQTRTFHLSDYISFRSTRENLDSFCGLLQHQFKQSALVKKINQQIKEISSKKQKNTLYKTLRMMSK